MAREVLLGFAAMLPVNQILLGDAIEVMKSLPDNAIDLIATDPPYFKVKKESWDRQWDKPVEFLKWLDSCAEQWQRILKPNGSLYCFASPQMSARVEVMLSDRFEVLNNIRWVKEAGWHQKANKEDARRYQNPWESIVFCEHYGSDNIAKGESGYGAKCDELRGFIFEPLRSYIVSEFKKTGINKIQFNVICGFSPSLGGMASRHYLSSSQWCLPTKEHYEKLAKATGCFEKPYEELRTQYEELRTQYEELRTQYEELRRPFTVSADVPYTDVWTFPTVGYYSGKHPCEKPLALMEHIISASSRPGAVVLDCFAGGGSTLLAAQNLGRDFIGVEKDEGYYQVALNRVAQHQSLEANEYPALKIVEPESQKTQGWKQIKLFG